MSEYTDMKHRKHKVIQTVREFEMSRGTKESHATVEQEIVEALFKIFQPKMTAK